MSGCVHAPRQARSQETFWRFVRATEELLDEQSFDAITVADIVERAERTVGSFYARFDDKYAVLHELVRRSYAHDRDVVAAFCDAERWEGRPLSDYVTEFVGLNVARYRETASLTSAALRACTSDERFRQGRIELMRYGADRQKSLLLARQAEMWTVDPARASDRMFELVMAMLDQELLFGRITQTSPRSDRELREKITEQALQVLGLGLEQRSVGVARA